MFWIELIYLGVSRQDQYDAYTNADFKPSLYIVTHINIILWKFRILDCKNSWVIHP